MICFWHITNALKTNITAEMALYPSFVYIVNVVLDSLLLLSDI